MQGSVVSNRIQVLGVFRKVTLEFFRVEKFSFQFLETRFSDRGLGNTTQGVITAIAKSIDLTHVKLVGLN